MGVLQAENNISYNSNNSVKIYIIKQEAYENKDRFEKDYASLLGDPTNQFAAINLKNAAIAQADREVKLVRLLTFDPPSKESLYKEYGIKKTIDRPKFYEGGDKDKLYVPESFYFLTSLCQLRNCPLIDFSKLAYVFQMDGQAIGGLANVISFNTTFSVNGQSSAELVINNKDFKYNFKYFNDKEKYPVHLKPFFDTNDIIIIRAQKKNTLNANLVSSFTSRGLDYWKDPYKESETDPFTTIFTGYINDVNNSFSFSNGQQQLTINCTGPSKKLTWTRFLSNKAAASQDSSDAITPISAFANPQTVNENGKTSTTNENVVKYAIVRTYSGVLNISEIKENYVKFVENFDKANNIMSDSEITSLQDKIAGTADTKKQTELTKQLNEYKTALRKDANEAKNKYNKLIDDNMNQYAVTQNDKVIIKKHLFTDFGDTPGLFEINGTSQPAYKYVFNNWSSLFKSDFSTVYQFIKGIADNLQFNFYDDPYGTIHFGVPDMSLGCLNVKRDPNNLTQIINFSETQNTENIANVQYAEADWIYDLPLPMINTVIKDYQSIAKYGEKLMQPFNMTGLIQPAAIKYAARMRMAKYNRKAMSNIRVTINGEPNLMMDKYAYIKSLRKLFYIESYSHSYNAGGDFTTSLNGTYTRDILCLADIVSNTSEKVDDNITLQKQLDNASSVEELNKLLDKIEFPAKDILMQQIYQMYIDNWKYPEADENLKTDIGALYTADNLKQCYLDGFFWAIPFDADPYQMAQQKAKEEEAMKAQMAKTNSAKTASATNIANANKKNNENIGKGNNTPKNNNKPKTNPPSLSNRVVGNLTESYTRIPWTKKLTVKKKYEPGTTFKYKPIEGNNE